MRVAELTLHVEEGVAWWCTGGYLLVLNLASKKYSGRGDVDNAMIVGAIESRDRNRVIIITGVESKMSALRVKGGKRRKTAPLYTELLTKSIPAPKPTDPLCSRLPCVLPPTLWCSSNSFRPTFARMLVNLWADPEVAGEGETLMKSLKLNGTLLPGVGGADGTTGAGAEADRSRGSARSLGAGVGEDGSRSNCAGVSSVGVGGMMVGGAGTFKCALELRDRFALGDFEDTRCVELLSTCPWPPPSSGSSTNSVSTVKVELKLLVPSLRRCLAPEDARSSPTEPDRGNRTRPLSVGLPPNVRNAAMSLASLSLDVEARTGDGEVARNNIKSAASVSLGG